MVSIMTFTCMCCCGWNGSSFDILQVKEETKIMIFWEFSFDLGVRREITRKIIFIYMSKTSYTIFLG